MYGSRDRPYEQEFAGRQFENLKMVSGLNLNVYIRIEVVFSEDDDAVKIKLIRQNGRRGILRRKCRNGFSPISDFSDQN